MGVGAGSGDGLTGTGAGCGGDVGAGGAAGPDGTGADGVTTGTGGTLKKAGGIDCATIGSPVGVLRAETSTPRPWSWPADDRWRPLPVRPSACSALRVSAEDECPPS